MLSMAEVKQLADDADWAQGGTGKGYMPASDVADLCRTIEIMCATIEVVYKELLEN